MGREEVNPYLEQFLSAQQEETALRAKLPPYKMADSYAKWRDIPAVEDYYKVHFRNNELRYKLVRKYSWAIPTDEAIAKIVSYSPIIEIGAGTGYWASLVQQAGGDIIAFDVNPPSQMNNDFKHTKEYIPIKFGTSETAREYPDRALLLCWPPRGDTMAYDTLCRYTGNILIYIGEGYGGCNADNNFFSLLGKDVWDEYYDHKYPDAKWEFVEEIDLPQWDTIHDYLSVYRRIK